MPPPPTAISLLEFGHLLWSNAQRSVTDREEAKIKQMEEHLTTLITDERPTILRSALDFNTIGKNIDPTTLRVVSLVAHLSLCTARLGTTVGEVACGLGRDAASILETRHVVSSLLIRKHLAFRDERSDCVALGKPLLDYFGGGADAPSLVPTECSLAQHQFREYSKSERRKAKTAAPIPSAKVLAAQIGNVVVGLDEQVRTLACRLTLHRRRAAMIRANQDPGTPNECLLIVGPSGSGKTFTCEHAGRISGLPFVSISSGDLTASGYIGVNLPDSLQPVITASDGDVQKARFAMAFYDEWDKKAATTMHWRDIGGVSVQQEMLRLMEGTQIQVGGRRGGYEPGVMLNTNGMMWLFSGAYTGLDQMLTKREKQGIGFCEMQDGSGRASAMYDALEQYGMLPEWINRLTGILVFPAPTVEQLSHICTQSILPAYNRLLGAHGMEIRMTDEAVRLVSERAKDSLTFARGTKAVISKLVEDLVFEERQGVIHLGATDVRRAVEMAGLGAVAAEGHPDSALQTRSF